MANSLIEQFKTYKLFKSLSERAGNVFTTVESYNAFMEQMQLSYYQGYELGDFEFALTLLETIAQEQSTNFSASKADGKLKITPTTPIETDKKGKVATNTETTVAESTNTEATGTETTGAEAGNNANQNKGVVKDIRYEDLLARAEKVFPSTQSYNDFVSQIDAAIQSGDNLTSFDFALTTFETLKASENSPYYQDELAKISADPQFSTFATIAENLNVAYAEPLFTATKEISAALEDATTLGVDASIVATTPTANTTEELMTQVKPTDKVVLQVDSNGLVSNPEALIGTGDGMVNLSQVTTNKLEEAKLSALQGKVESAGSEAEATAIVDSYNSSLSANTVNSVDISETYSGNADSGTSTNTNPFAKEVKDLATDAGTAIDIKEQLDNVGNAYIEAIKKLNVETAEAGLAPADGPSLEA